MSYEAMTVGDPNPIKRHLHRRRYSQAIQKMPMAGDELDVLDFGAGSGELTHYVFREYPRARVTLFEPATKYREELERNIEPYEGRVRVATSFKEFSEDSFSHIFCLSLLEHLPDEQLIEALGRIHQVSYPETPTLVEVPNEIFAAALLKGALRHIRRPDEHDGKVKNILSATLGNPPEERRLTNFDPGSTSVLPWHGYHLGFDHRVLEQTIEDSGLFQIDGPDFAPLNCLGSVASLDVYYSLTPA